MRYSIHSVVRNRMITVAVAAVVAAMTFFLSFFSSGIQKNHAQLDALCETMTVTAAVTGHRDAATASLSEEQYRRILGSGFVRQESAMIQKRVNNTCSLRAMSDFSLEPELEGWVPYLIRR